MEKSKSGINETRADLNLLLECLKCQLDCPSALKQALITISSVCLNQGGSKDYLRDCGGLQFIFNLATSTGYVEVKETAIYAIGCAVEGNVFSQKLMSTREPFMFLHGCLSNHYDRKKLQQTATYCVLCLVANNGQGQMLLRKSGCLQVLLNLFRTTLTTENLDGCDGEESNLQLWLSVCSTLCVGVNNPQNDDNQRLCASGFPYALKCLEEATEIKILRSAASFIGVTVANNVNNQDRITKCDGLTALINVMYKVINRVKTSDEYVELSVHVTKALDACVADNAENARICGDAGAIALLLKLLAMDAADTQLKIQIALAIGHCTDICAMNQTIVKDCGGINILIQQLTQSTDDELSKAIKYVLQTCVNVDERQLDNNARRCKSPFAMSNLNPSVFQNGPYGMNVVSPTGIEAAGGGAILRKLGDLARKLQEGPSSYEMYDMEPEMQEKSNVDSSLLVEKQSLLQQLEKERNLRKKYETESYELKRAQQQTPVSLKCLEDLLKKAQESGRTERGSLKRPWCQGLDGNCVQSPTPFRNNANDSIGPYQTSTPVSPPPTLRNRSCEQFEETNITPDRTQRHEIESINQKLNNLQVTLENFVDKNTRGNNFTNSKSNTTREASCTNQGNVVKQSQPRRSIGYLGQEQSIILCGTKQTNKVLSNGRPATSTPKPIPKKFLDGPKRHTEGSVGGIKRNPRTPGEERKGDSWIDVPSTPRGSSVTSRGDVCQSPLDLVLPKITMTPSRKRVVTRVANVPPGTPVKGQAVRDVERDGSYTTPQSVKSTRSNISVRSARKGHRTLELVYTVDSDSETEENVAGAKKKMTPKNQTPDEEGFLRPQTPVKRRRLSAQRPGSEVRSRTPQRQLFHPEAFYRTQKSRANSSVSVGVSPVTHVPKKSLDCGLGDEPESDSASVHRADRRREPRRSTDQKAREQNVRITPRKVVNQAKTTLVFSVEKSREKSELGRNSVDWNSKARSLDVEKSREKSALRRNSVDRKSELRRNSVDRNSKARSLDVGQGGIGYSKSINSTSGNRSRSLSMSEIVSQQIRGSDDKRRHSDSFHASDKISVGQLRKAATPTQQGIVRQNASLTGVRSSRLPPEQKVAQSCQSTRKLLKMIRGGGMREGDESFCYEDSDDLDDTMVSSQSSSIMEPKNNQQCPGCQPAGKINAQTLNSRTYNIALETSYYTCNFHRKLRELERDYMGTAAPAMAGSRTPLDRQTMKKPTTSMSVYDFPPSPGSDSGDKQVTPPRESPMAALPNSLYDQTKRRPRIPYSDEELRNLKDGVKKMGKFWNQILFTYKFHPSRQPIDLMEKYKRIMAKESKRANKSPRKTRRPFSMCEERRLRRGVKLYGYNWRTILMHFKFCRDRTAEQLRLKWRNMNKQRND